MSQGLYFIIEGRIDVYHQNCHHPLLKFDPGSYFGEISYIFKLKN